MQNHLTFFLLVALNYFAALGSPNAMAADASTSSAAQAVNALGLELLAKGTDARDNAILSPYSIQLAMAMAYAGSDGITRSEMARVLHYLADEETVHGSFAALQKALGQRRQIASGTGALIDPVTLLVANSLFGQSGYEFRRLFLELVNDRYGAPFQTMDFVLNASTSRMQINRWVEAQTRSRIHDLIPPNGLDPDTRLVLVNAVYFKAPWNHEFSADSTRPLPFHLTRNQSKSVPTMSIQQDLGYAHREGFSVVAVPYGAGDMQFLILLPDDVDGLAALESKLSAQMLAEAANPPVADVILRLPKFKLEPPLLKLSAAMKLLGMNSAFDQPEGSANFDRMAPRKPDGYLRMSEVFHKAFLEIDEKGTEAAAATAVSMLLIASKIGPHDPPIEVRVDRPFLFAIQHRASGACLFLGRITDPR